MRSWVVARVVLDRSRSVHPGDPIVRRVARIADGRTAKPFVRRAADGKGYVGRHEAPTAVRTLDRTADGSTLHSG